MLGNSAERCSKGVSFYRLSQNFMDKGCTTSVYVQLWLLFILLLCIANINCIFWHNWPSSSVQVGFRRQLLMWALLSSRGHMVAEWLRHYATNHKVAGSIPDEVNF
jgi:hypothetical protein